MNEATTNEIKLSKADF